MNKEIYHEVQLALKKLEELDKHINSAIDMSNPGSFLHDTLLVAQRNSAGIEMKLLVARDVVQTYSS